MPTYSIAGFTPLGYSVSRKSGHRFCEKDTLKQ